jgi:hypothetical protein
MDSRVTKATLEFFLIVLRHLCDKLQLPVVVGSHKLGLFAAAKEDESSFRLAVHAWQQWRDLEALLKSGAKELVVPVITDDSRALRKLLFVRVLSADEGSPALVDTKSFKVVVVDRLARKPLARDLAEKFVGLIRSVNQWCGRWEARDPCMC